MNPILYHPAAPTLPEVHQGILEAMSDAYLTEDKEELGEAVGRIVRLKNRALAMEAEARVDDPMGYQAALEAHLEQLVSLKKQAMTACEGVEDAALVALAGALDTYEKEVRLKMTPTQADMEATWEELEESLELVNVFEDLALKYGCRGWVVTEAREELEATLGVSSLKRRIRSGCA